MKLYIAKIKDFSSEWNEEYTVPDDIKPEDYVKSFIDHWNGRNDKKYKRSLVGVTDAGELEYTFERMQRDAGKFYDYCRRQEANAYGHRGVKHDYKKIMSAYNKFSKGTFGDFTQYVNSYKGYDHDNLEKLMKLTKEEYDLAKKKFKKDAQRTER